MSGTPVLRPLGRTSLFSPLDSATRLRCQNAMALLGALGCPALLSRRTGTGLAVPYAAWNVPANDPVFLFLGAHVAPGDVYGEDR